MSIEESVKGETKTVQGEKRLSLWNSRFLWHIQLLGQRLYVFSLVRFLVASGIVVGALFARHVVGIERLRVSDLYFCAAFLAIYNLGVMLAVRPYREPDQVERGFRLLNRIAHGTIVIDYLVLTYAIWLVGGGRSPFLAFYLLHAILASVLLSRRSAFAHAAIGYFLLTAIVVGEWMQWIPRNRPLGAVFGGSDQDIRPILTVLFVYGLLTAVATYLMTGIASALRAGERRLRTATEELENLANLRRAFLHVVMHDIRSPVSTVVTLLETLASGEVGALSDKQKEWIARAEVQLRGMLKLLHDLQILADIETGGLEKAMEPVDLRIALGEVVEDHIEAAQQGGLELRAELPDTLARVQGVDRLLREAVANYITNAIKYNPPGNIITVRARPLNDMIRIEVADNGSGISGTDQERLFREFVRVRKPTDTRSSRPPSRPPGTGLGLSIVRRIAEAHRGRAGVVSQLGQGSTFYIELPAITPEG
jgi:signal transduction histidine kinase